MRRVWLTSCLLVLLPLPLASQVPVTAPILRWVRSTSGVAAVMDVGAHCHSIDAMSRYEEARLEFAIAMRHAHHVRLAGVYLANEALLEEGDNPTSRSIYTETVSGANTRYITSASNAYNQYLQQTTQRVSGRSRLEVLQSDWETARADLTQAGQWLVARLGQDGPLEVVEMEEMLQQGTMPDLDAQDLALTEARRTADRAYVDAVAAADAAWREACLTATDAGGADDQVRNDLDAANRDWLRAATDALDRNREAMRAALRQLELNADEALK